METLKTIAYDFEATGRRIITIPSELPFSDHFEGLLNIRDF